MGHVRPKAIPGRPSKKIKPLQAGLQAQLEAFTDATLAQHCQYWEQRKPHAGEPVEHESCHPKTERDTKKKTLAHQPFGPVLLGIVALGLIAYGVYSFVEARYRRVGRG